MGGGLSGDQQDGQDGDDGEDEGRGLGRDLAAQENDREGGAECGPVGDPQAEFEDQGILEDRLQGRPGYGQGRAGEERQQESRQGGAGEEGGGGRRAPPLRPGGGS